MIAGATMVRVEISVGVATPGLIIVVAATGGATIAEAAATGKTMAGDPISGAVATGAIETPIPLGPVGPMAPRPVTIPDGPTAPAPLTTPEGPAAPAPVVIPDGPTEPHAPHASGLTTPIALPVAELVARAKTMKTT